MTNYEKYFNTVGHAADSLRKIIDQCNKAECKDCIIFEPCCKPGIDYLEWLQEEAE